MVNDYSQSYRHISKTLAAALFMLFATLFSTVALGTIIQKVTHDRIGLSEYLLMNSAAGVLHAVFGAQPLLVLRPTGPITAILGKLSDLSDRFAVDFHQLLAATGLWVALLMALIAASEASRHIRRLTPFTHDIFACFVCSIYVHDGVRDVLSRFAGLGVHTHDKTSQQQHFEQEALFARALFAAVLAAFTFGASSYFSGAQRWRILSPSLRALIADYAVTLAVLLAAALSWMPAPEQVAVERIALPATLSPTCYHLAGGGGGGGAHESCIRNSIHAAESGQRHLVPRAWLVSSLGGVTAHLWLLALGCAVPITFFFYMDQNISSCLCQLPEMRLRKGHYYHSSFLAMGLFNGLGPLLGLPFVTGSLPHSPQFVRALMRTGNDGSRRVVEGRLAPLLMYIGIGVPLLAPSLVQMLPEATIAGVLAVRHLRSTLPRPNGLSHPLNPSIPSFPAALSFFCSPEVAGSRTRSHRSTSALRASSIPSCGSGSCSCSRRATAGQPASPACARPTSQATRPYSSSSSPSAGPSTSHRRACASHSSSSPSCPFVSACCHASMQSAPWQRSIASDTTGAQSRPRGANAWG